MSIIKRISATITSKVDDVVSHVENHDAVVEAALKDTRASLAKAKVRLARVQKDGDNLKNKVDDLNKNKNLWSERAKTIAKTDKNKALECVHRRNLCTDEIVRIKNNIDKHNELDKRISTSVHRMEQRLSELTQQRNMMRSRHSAADAMRVINQIENTSTSGIEDTFDRWEMLITETEYHNGVYDDAEFTGDYTNSTDSLDASFSEAENQNKLEAELEFLLGEDDDESINNSKLED